MNVDFLDQEVAKDLQEMMVPKDLAEKLVVLELLVQEGHVALLALLAQLVKVELVENLEKLVALVHQEKGVNQEDRDHLGHLGREVNVAQ